nr:hypothetical protein B0A51_03661 [Rachicladosporium sp. CCFEE 5018]
MAADSVIKESATDSPTTTTSSELEKQASFRLLDLPKELRLDILDLVVGSSKPFVTIQSGSDELVSTREFERRCARFVETPVLHICKCLRGEAIPIVRSAVQELIIDLEAAYKEWQDIPGVCDGQEIPIQLCHRVRFEEECAEWSGFCLAAHQTELAWNAIYDKAWVATMAVALSGQDSRVVRRYRKVGDRDGGDMHEMVPFQVDWDKVAAQFAPWGSAVYEQLVERFPTLREYVKSPNTEVGDTGAL